MADLLPRRQGGHQPPKRTSKAMVASAAKLPIGTTAAAAVVKRRLEWQREVWEAYDAVGEVKYGSGYQGNAMSRLNLYVGVRPDDPEADPTPITDRLPDGWPEGEPSPPQLVDPATFAACQDTLNRLAGSTGGHGDVLRELAVNVVVAGECYLYGRTEPARDPEPDEAAELVPVRELWDVRSIDEVRATAEGTIRVVDRPDARDQDGEVVSQDAYLIRVWQRHARFGGLPDSMLRGVLGATEELLLMEQAARASARSRLNAGMLLVPDELEFVPVRPTAEGEDQVHDDTFLADLMDAMVTPVQDEGDASAVVPMVVRGAAEYLSALRHLDFTRQLDGQVLARQDAALKRIAQGMNLPVEIITGMGDVNHWTAWQVDDATWKGHLEPLAIMLVNALTEGFLYPFLEAAGVDRPERFVVWYDPSRLIARPNLAQAANEAHDRKVISDDAYRKARGFNDEDAPSQDPSVADAIAMVRSDPGLMRDPGLPALIAALRQARDATSGDTAALPAPAPDEPDADPQADPTPDQPDGPDDGAPSVIGAAVGEPRVPADLGRRLRDIDRDLRNRVEAAADGQMRRALERAGAQLRTKARRQRAASDAVSGVTNDRVAATLGPALVQSLGVSELELLEGAFTPLGDRFIRWCKAAGDATLDAIPALDPAERQLQDAHLSELAVDAWRWLEAELVERATSLLYDPEPTAPERGEFDDVTVVPFDLIREAIARAGGLTEHQTTVAAGDPIMDAATRTAVGIATGLLSRQLLDDAGVATEAYEWEYGPYQRSQGFEPHVLLDGLVFESFTDDALANEGDWPPVAFFMPGDHRGCRCDVTPVLIDAKGRPTPEAELLFEGPTGEELARGLLTAPESAPSVPLRRHPAGGYTYVDEDGVGYYVRQLITNEGRPGAWRIEEQFLGPDGGLMARVLGEARTLHDVRKVVGAKLAGLNVDLVGQGVRDFAT